MVNVYTKGSVIHLTVALVNEISGSPVNPSSLQAIVIDPNGSIANFSFPGLIIQDGIGSFHLDYSTTTVAGDYTYRWSATGVGQAALEGVWNVAPSRFP